MFCRSDHRNAPASKSLHNQIQWNAGLRKGVAFNYVPGRNNVTGNAKEKVGFAYQKEFKVKNLVGSGWERVRRDDTYIRYLSTLKECLTHFPEYKLYDLEMVLFSNAEIECIKAMNSLENI